MIEYGLLCAKRLAEVLLKLSNMKNTLEFEIPDGYELDKEKSTGSKIVYKKKEEYEPKLGDLVVTELDDLSRRFIQIYGANIFRTPSLTQDFENDTIWHFISSSEWFYTNIRPATPDEAALFSRILSENGYEYDPEKKEVRKKRWRAEKGGQYFYVSSSLIVCISSDLYCLQGNVHYSIGNYFRTREEAEEVAAEFRKILNNKKA